MRLWYIRESRMSSRVFLSESIFRQGYYHKHCMDTSTRGMVASRNHAVIPQKNSLFEPFWISTLNMLYFWMCIIEFFLIIDVFWDVHSDNWRKSWIAWVSMVSLTSSQPFSICVTMDVEVHPSLRGFMDFQQDIFLNPIDYSIQVYWYCCSNVSTSFRYILRYLCPLCRRW